VKSAIYIPLGTRFGPLVGEVCVKEHAPNGKRKYFWRVSTDRLLHTVYGFS